LSESWKRSHTQNSLTTTRLRFTVILTLRPVRTLKTSSGLMVLMESIFEALAPTVSVLIMICILFYIFAILFTEVIGHNPQFEGDAFIHDHFGTVGNSLVTLLHILTLDS
jgi:hypothetical protein